MKTMITTPTAFLVKVDAILESYLPEETFTINQLAKKLGFSYSHTHRKIKNATGLSPSVYIRNKRLDNASRLLIHTDLTINQIAAQVGFTTQSYFSAKFSEYKNCSPKQYRKRNIEYTLNTQVS